MDNRCAGRETFRTRVPRTVRPESGQRGRVSSRGGPRVDRESGPRIGVIDTSIAAAARQLRMAASTVGLMAKEGDPETDSSDAWSGYPSPCRDGVDGPPRAAQAEERGARRSRQGGHPRTGAREASGAAHCRQPARAWMAPVCIRSVLTLQADQVDADLGTETEAVCTVGSWTVTHMPPPERARRSSLPSWAWMMVLTTAKPRPTPAWALCSRPAPR